MWWLWHQVICSSDRVVLEVEQVDNLAASLHRLDDLRTVRAQVPRVPVRLRLVLKIEVGMELTCLTV
jgi:hypothetical protein